MRKMADGCWGRKSWVAGETDVSECSCGRNGGTCEREGCWDEAGEPTKAALGFCS